MDSLTGSLNKTPITLIVDINDTKHRYYLGREETHKEMEPLFNVKFTTIGKYYPNKKMATLGAPPLQLHITGSNQSDIDQAVSWVNEIKEKGPPSLASSSTVSKKPLGGQQPIGFNPEKIEKRLFIPFEYAETHLFALRNAILGPHGNYLKFISGQSGASVSLRGRSSGSILTQEDKLHAFHIYVTAATEKQVSEAEAMVKDLYNVLQFEYAVSKQFGYFTPLGGMFAPDYVLVQIEKGLLPQQQQPSVVAPPTIYPFYLNQLPPQPSHQQFPFISYAASVQQPKQNKPNDK